MPTLIALVLLAHYWHAPAQAVSPQDFTGRWRLAEQTTSAFRHRSAIGNHEEPVVIEQRGSRLIVAVQSSDPAAVFEYDLSGAELVRVGPAGERLSTVSRWEHSTLVTKGRRAFTTPEGPRVFDFEESRRLSPNRQQMVVNTRIKMSWQDLRRTSTYERTPGK